MSSNSAMALVKLVRPHQWVKNTLLAVPLITSHTFAADKLWLVALAFVSFSFAASAGYAINDVLDAKADRQNPHKQKRPVASGAVSPSLALATAFGLLASSLGLAGAYLPLEFLYTVVLYTCLSITYTLILKRLLLVDVLILAGLYCLRIFAGAVVVGVAVSSWLLAFGMFVFVSLAFVKRYVELFSQDASMESEHGKISRRAYKKDDQTMFMVAGLSTGHASVLVLALYISTPGIQELYREPERLWFMCPLIFYWITRIWFLAHRNKVHNDPVVFALKDPASWTTLVLGALVLLLGQMK